MLKFFVINYGLKSVAWFVVAVLLTIHATGVSQLLMKEFDERRIFFGENSEGTAPAVPKFLVGQEPDPPNYYLSFAVRHLLRRWGE